MARALRADELLDAAAIAAGSGSAIFADWLLARLGEADNPAALAIGERDARLARLRAASFGDRLELAASCPACTAPLDVMLSTAALPTPAAAPPFAQLDISGVPCRVWPATSLDLAEVAELPDEESARALLAERCLEPPEGVTLAPLGEADIAAVAAALAELDPAADPYVTLTCPACAAEWDAPIDLPQLLAADITGAAVGLIDDVHDLALAYNWSEAAILALPAARRHAYLARVRG